MFFKLFTATSWLLNSFHYIIESFTDFFYTATSLSLDGHHYKQISPSKDHSQIIVTLLVSGNYSFFSPMITSMIMVLLHFAFPTCQCSHEEVLRLRKVASQLDAEKDALQASLDDRTEDLVTLKRDLDQRTQLFEENKVPSISFGL